jgi:hypothetical protein
MNLSFLGGGITPFIHPSLLNKKKKKYNKVDNEDKIKKHRFRNGTIALKNIKKYQKTDNLIFPKSSFEKFTRNISRIAKL